MNTYIKLLFLAYSFISIPSFVLCQSETDLKRTILSLDSAFWHSYNTCDIEGMGNYVSDDIEFYHDKGGLTESKKALLEGIKNGLCSDENYSLRREELKGAVEVFPMNNFGAIMTGQHVFYVKQGDDPEFLDGLARFTHLWQFKNEEWKMIRILSYDHGPAPQDINKKKYRHSNEELAHFVGSYNAPSSGKVVVTVSEGNLFLDAGEMKTLVYGQSANVFYHGEAPLTFEFVKTSAGLVEKMIVRENGKIVEEAVRE